YDGSTKLVRRIRQPVGLHDTPGVADLSAVALTYPAAPGARFSVYGRTHESDAPVLLHDRHVHSIDPWTLKIDPQPGVELYDIVYDATDAVVSGIGLSVPRDLVSFLRYERGEANPLADAQGNLRISHCYAYGISQSGRFLRC